MAHAGFWTVADAYGSLLPAFPGVASMVVQRAARGNGKTYVNDIHSMEAGDELDPQIRRFVDTVIADFDRRGPFKDLSIPERRASAELVRAPWASGGPTTVITELNVPGRVRDIRVRLHHPVTDSFAPMPAIIYLHGGGWTLFSLDTHDRLMREYAARAGAIVVGVDYSLSPEAKYPVALHEVLDVIAWLRDTSEVHGIAPDRIAIAGDSAGGNLSVATCLALRAEHQPPPRGMLLNYAALDTWHSDAAVRRYGGPRYMLGADEMEEFWRNYTRAPSDRDDPLCCPARAEYAGLPPAFFAIAACDILAEQNVEIAERMRRAGVAVDARVYQGASHSFLEAVSISELSDRALEEGAAWLRDVLAD